jgi:uncharacterized protein YjbK
MSSNIEIEAKVLVSKDEYTQIVKSLELQKYKKFKQTNYYIDSDDRVIKKLGYALRVREKNEEFELTLKTPLSEGKLEKNETISWRVFEDLRDNGIFPESGIKKFLLILGIDVSKLKIITSLTTERIRIDYSETDNVVVDKSTYNGQVDYELEAESTSMDNARELLKKVLLECGVQNFTFNEVSKQARALNSLK